MDNRREAVSDKPQKPPRLGQPIPQQIEDIELPPRDLPPSARMDRMHLKQAAPIKVSQRCGTGLRIVSKIFAEPLCMPENFPSARTVPY